MGNTKPEKIDRELEYLAGHFGVEKPTWDRVKKSPITWYSKKKVIDSDYGLTTTRTHKAKAHCHIEENEIIFHSNPTKPILYHGFMRLLKDRGNKEHLGEGISSKENCPFCQGFSLEEKVCEECGEVFKTRIPTLDTCHLCQEKE